MCVCVCVTVIYFHWCHFTDFAKYSVSNITSYSHYFQAKKQYEKAFKESEKAQENYRKADADIHLSRADVEKVIINTQIDRSVCLNVSTLLGGPGSVCDVMSNCVQPDGKHL